VTGDPGVGAAAALPGTESHPQARMILSAALAGDASHAYLFHGPSGVGKRTAARAFAAELLAAGSPDPAGARHRVLDGAHPDLTWVRPTGAHVMRTEDVAAPVVAAAARTPFESLKRVFVLERVDTMNDEVANRLLKTLEEPPAYVHLILLTDSLGLVLPTVISRCQLVRFDPLPAARIAADLVAAGVPAELAGACARLALGNGARARFLASEEGEALTADVDRLVATALGGPGSAPEPWRGLLDRADERRAVAEDRVADEAKQRLESEPKGRERGALEKQFEDASKREGRRARTEVLDMGLTLAALRFRDLLCLAEGAEGAALDAAGARALLAGRDEDAADLDPRRLREAAERCEEARMSLQLNVTEELALEALGFRLADLVGTSV